MENESIESPVEPESGASESSNPYCLTAPPATEPVVQTESRPAPRRRRVKLPAILFVVTCLSTFWAGATDWAPVLVMENCVLEWSLMPIRRALLANWSDGLIYMSCLLAILFTHEMGHFIATLRYRIPASLPFFLPLPISPIGTLGAVIGMDGLKADRKEVFDIGVAGPLAGLVIALPMMWIGIVRLDTGHASAGMFAVDLPLATQLLLHYLRPGEWQAGEMISNTQLNPYFMAAWVGLIVTGLNMLPVSQLDGGHVTYALFKRRAHWIARGFMLLAISYMLFAWQLNLIIMITLVMLIGTDHPPTRDDNVRLGWFRFGLGLAALTIPLFCLAPRLLIPY